METTANIIFGAEFASHPRWRECGHVKSPENTHTINGIEQCKRCRRDRWNKGFRRVVNRRNGVPETVEQICARLPKRRNVVFETFLRVASYHFQIEPHEICNKVQSYDHRAARSIIAKVLRDRGMTLKEISKLMGGKERTAARAWINSFETHCRRDPTVREVYEILTNAPELEGAQ